MIVRFKMSEMVFGSAQVERMGDILSMGLTDGKEIAQCLVSTGLTVETLFAGGSIAI